ncbi:MAG: carbohydrate-binding domain-containing protein [Alloprevotella sp.]
MKRLSLLFILAVSVVCEVCSQTLDVRCGSVTWRYDANVLSAARKMSFSAGSQLNVGGAMFDLAGTMLRANPSGQPEALTVEVQFGDSPQIIADGSLADYLTCKVEGRKVSITASPQLTQEVVYRLSGTGESFTLTGDYKSTIELNGVTLKATGTTPALYIVNGKRIDIQCAAGTTNYFEDAAANTAKSAFYVKGHAEWKGGGTVNILGNARHAYSSNEYTDLKASFTGTLNILGAKGDGMHIEQYLIVNGGTVNVSKTLGDAIDVSYTYEDDGVTHTNDSLNGQVHIKNGVLNLTVDADDTKALKSDDCMLITGGTINAVANGNGSRGINVGIDLTVGTKGSTDQTNPYIYLTANGDTYTAPDGDTAKCRGIKVKRNFYFYSGLIKRNPTSKVSSTKMVDVDGLPTVSGGKLDGVTIN